MVYRVALIAVALLVTACSDSKTANEKNFKIGIQKTLDMSYPKCYIKANFPTTIETSGFDGLDKLSAKALVASGILSVKEESRIVSGFMGARNVIQSVFSLTDEGKKYYKADAGTTIMGQTTGGFCFGKANVKDITEFTEPADVNGMHMSQVTYTYQMSDIPAWAKQPEVMAAIGGLKRDVEAEKSPAKSMAMLVLTNNGWVSKFGAMYH